MKIFYYSLLKKDCCFYYSSELTCKLYKYASSFFSNLTREEKTVFIKIDSSSLGGRSNPRRSRIFTNSRLNCTLIIELYKAVFCRVLSDAARLYLTFLRNSEL